MTMIKKVARAIQDCPFPATNIDKAKAAIEAMREPSEAMIKVSCSEEGYKKCWQASIDVALKEE